MLPTIGLMVAAIGLTVCGYVMTRCMSLLVGDQKSGHGAVVLFAVVTICLAGVAAIVIVILTLDLMTLGSAPTDLDAYR